MVPIDAKKLWTFYLVEFKPFIHFYDNLLEFTFRYMYVCKSLVWEEGDGKLPKYFCLNFIVIIIQIFYLRMGCQSFLFQLHLIAYACTFRKKWMGVYFFCVLS